MAYHTRNNNSSNNRSLNEESKETIEKTKRSSLKKMASKFPKLSINNNRSEGRIFNFTH